MGRDQNRAELRRQHRRIRGVQREGQLHLLVEEVEPDVNGAGER